LRCVEDTCLCSVGGSDSGACKAAMYLYIFVVVILDKKLLVEHGATPTNLISVIIGNEASDRPAFVYSICQT
jgi:hypothetical protein